MHQLDLLSHRKKLKLKIEALIAFSITLCVQRHKQFKKIHFTVKSIHSSIRSEFKIHNTTGNIVQKIKDFQYVKTNRYFKNTNII